MIPPGPVVIAVGFIGYLVAGFSGADVAALATFIHCYLLTILHAPYFKKYGRRPSIKAFVDGITAAVVGALVCAIIIAISTNVDIPTALIAAFSVIVLSKFKKIKEPQVILVAAILGLILKSL